MNVFRESFKDLLDCYQNYHQNYHQNNYLNKISSRKFADSSISNWRSKRRLEFCENKKCVIFAIYPHRKKKIEKTMKFVCLNFSS